jgi:hypothetical protein
MPSKRKRESPRVLRLIDELGDGTFSYEELHPRKQIRRNSALLVLAILVLGIGTFVLVAGQSRLAEMFGTDRIDLSTNLTDGYARGILPVEFHTESSLPIDQARIDVNSSSIFIDRDTIYPLEMTPIPASIISHYHAQVIGANNMSYLSEKDGQVLKIQRTSGSSLSSTGFWYLSAYEIGVNLTLNITFTPSKQTHYHVEFYNYSSSAWKVLSSGDSNTEVTFTQTFTDLTPFKTSLHSSATERCYTAQIRIQLEPESPPSGFYINLDQFILITHRNTTNFFTDDFEYSLNTQAYLDGFYAMNLSVFDSIGRSASLTRGIFFDNTYPSILYFEVTPLIGSVKIDGNVSDNHKLKQVIIEYENDSGQFIAQDLFILENASVIFNLTRAFLNGTYNIRLIASDCAGNILIEERNLTYFNEINSVPIIIPTLILSEIDRPENAIVGLPYPITIGLSTPLSSVKVYYKGDLIVEILNKNTQIFVFEELGIQMIVLKYFYNGSYLSEQEINVKVIPVPLEINLGDILSSCFIVAGGLGIIYALFTRRRIIRI